MQANQNPDMESRILEARQGLVRPHRAIQAAIANPPPTPSCWRSRADWLDWLALTYTAGLPITRRKDTGKYRGERVVTLVALLDIDHCICCTSKFKASMQQRGRCQPSAAERERELKQSRGPTSEPPTTADPATGINHDESAETA
jgi:hypothetical protein